MYNYKTEEWMHLLLDFYIVYSLFSIETRASVHEKSSTKTDYFFKKSTVKN